MVFKIPQMVLPFKVLGAPFNRIKARIRRRSEAEVDRFWNSFDDSGEFWDAVEEIKEREEKFEDVDKYVLEIWDAENGKTVSSQKTSTSSIVDILYYKKIHEHLDGTQIVITRTLTHFYELVRKKGRQLFLTKELDLQPIPPEEVPQALSQYYSEDEFYLVDQVANYVGGHKRSIYRYAKEKSLGRKASWESACQYVPFWLTLKRPGYRGPQTVFTREEVLTLKKKAEKWKTKRNIKNDVPRLEEAEFLNTGQLQGILSKLGVEVSKYLLETWAEKGELGYTCWTDEEEKWVFTISHDIFVKIALLKKKKENRKDFEKKRDQFWEHYSREFRGETPNTVRGIPALQRVLKKYHGIDISKHFLHKWISEGYLGDTYKNETRKTPDENYKWISTQENTGIDWNSNSVKSDRWVFTKAAFDRCIELYHSHKRR